MRKNNINMFVFVLTLISIISCSENKPQKSSIIDSFSNIELINDTKDTNNTLKTEDTIWNGYANYFKKIAYSDSVVTHSYKLNLYESRLELPQNYVIKYIDKLYKINAERTNRVYGICRIDLLKNYNCFFYEKENDLKSDTYLSIYNKGNNVISMPFSGETYFTEGSMPVSSYDSFIIGKLDSTGFNMTTVSLKFSNIELVVKGGEVAPYNGTEEISNYYIDIANKKTKLLNQNKKAVKLDYIKNAYGNLYIAKVN